MPKLTIASWNAEGMFVTGTRTKRATTEDGVRVLGELHADIVIIPEFGQWQKLRSETRKSIERLGYEIVEVLYDDGYEAPYTIAILSRLPIIEQQTIRPGGIRNMPRVICRTSQGNLLSVYGIHLDDRSEVARQEQAKELATLINSDQNSKIVAGDFNSMPSASLFARVCRVLFRPRVISYLPNDFVRSLFGRLYEMASGHAVGRVLDETSLIDLDGQNRPTVSAKQADLSWAPSWRLAKIDWVMASPDLQVQTYRVWRDVGSDHRPIVVELQR